MEAELLNMMVECMVDTRVDVGEQALSVVKLEEEFGEKGGGGAEEEALVDEVGEEVVDQRWRNLREMRGVCMVDLVGRWSSRRSLRVVVAKECAGCACVFVWLRQHSDKRVSRTGSNVSVSHIGLPTVNG